MAEISRAVALRGKWGKNNGDRKGAAWGAGHALPPDVDVGGCYMSSFLL